MSILANRPPLALAALAVLAAATIPSTARAQALGGAARADRGAQVLAAAVRPATLAPDERLPRPLDDARPAYPEEMLRRGVEGDVVVEFLVAADGRPRMRSLVAVQSTDDLFATAVRDAIAQSRYLPGEERGEPVPMWIKRVYRFRVTRDAQGAVRSRDAVVTAERGPGV